MNESPETLTKLQEIIDRSAATAGAAIKSHFIGGGWSMSSEEFVAFWGSGRMATVSTVSADGKVHAAPLEIGLVDGTFSIPTFADTQRLRDHRANPRCTITSWDNPYRAVIVYGAAQESSDGKDGAMTTIKVTPTRIYAIRPPQGHHAARRP
ncbi:MAG: pyridoxamine 5'-phosphate oxidase family protein [Chloroflexi bacterium]|nr:pyridoxamine 5'-phosphate oxidase family protein [Chloroflexota bacterium]